MTLNTRVVAQIAKVCHEANRAYCEGVLGDTSQVPWSVAPNWQQQSAIEGVSKIITGEITTPEEAHDAWAASKIADGWVYGPQKDADRKTHPCLVPYLELPVEQRLKDKLFFAIVRALV